MPQKFGFTKKYEAMKTEPWEDQVRRFVVADKEKRIRKTRTYLTETEKGLLNCMLQRRRLVVTDNGGKDVWFRGIRELT